MTTLAMVALFVAGVIAYWQLPISSMPNVTYPTINVKTTFPGALPETMANAIALPLEKQLMAIPGIRLVSSNNTLGSSSIILQFQIDKDMLTAAQDVQEAVTSALPYLPPGIPYGPTYRKVNPAEQPVIYLCLTSKTMPRTDLYTYANTLIGQRISMLTGVSQVTTFGSVLAYRVQLDPAQLAAHDITLNEVAIALKLGNAFLSTGQLDGEVEAPLISVDGQLMSSSAYEALIVAYRNGTPVKISDLGRVIANFQNNKIYSQFIDAKGAQESVTLAIQKEPGGNTVEIADSIYELMQSLKGELPPAIDIHTVYDRSIPIRAAIEDANKTLLLALFFVVLVIFLFLGKWADTLIPSLVLPMSVFSTFIVMRMFNFTLDNLSILALTLAIGFIVDDAVVVMENIVRRVEAGDTPLQAALEGSRQICFTIASMTLSLIAVFVPILFMGGLIGKIFSEFAITLTAITLISGIISLTLTPMLCSRFIPPRDQTKKSRIARWSAAFNEKLLYWYRKGLHKALDYDKLMLGILFVCLLATVFLFYKVPTDFTPDEDVGFFTIYVQEREGGSSFSMRDNEEKIIDIVKKNPAVDSFVAISSYSEYRKGLNLVHLKPNSERAPIQKVIQDIDTELKKNIPDVQAFLKNIPLIDLAAGQESRAAYQFALQSVFAERLYPSAKRLIESMRGDPMFVGVNSDLEVDTPQVNVALLRDQGSTYGITATDIENAFSYSYSGNFVTRVQTAIDQYDVILELLPEYQRQTAVLNNIWLRSAISKELVPLSAAISWEEGLGASSINHIDQFPSVTLSFNLSPGVALETALNRLNELTAKLLEPGVSAQPIGAAQTFKESIQSSGYLLILTLFSIYVILGILYESFIHPLTILSTLPPATLGGLLTLLVLGMPLSMYAFLGIILLIGIVKKNGIMVVDLALENIRHKGMTAKEAILDASSVRFRPIMMTTAAAIFGVLPIALGVGANASARRPLGLVIIGGLLLSQLITLFITPVLYLEFERLHDKYFKARKAS